MQKYLVQKETGTVFLIEVEAESEEEAERKVRENDYNPEDIISEYGSDCSEVNVLKEE